MGLVYLPTFTIQIIEVSVNIPVSWMLWDGDFPLPCSFGDYIWMFPKIVVPQNEWFILKNLIKNGWFGGTIIFGNIHIFIPLPAILQVETLLAGTRASLTGHSVGECFLHRRSLGTHFRSYWRIWFLYSQVQIILAYAIYIGNSKWPLYFLLGDYLAIDSVT